MTPCDIYVVYADEFREAMQATGMYGILRLRVLRSLAFRIRLRTFGVRPYRSDGELHAVEKLIAALPPDPNIRTWSRRDGGEGGHGDHGDQGVVGTFSDVLLLAKHRRASDNVGAAVAVNRAKVNGTAMAAATNTGAAAGTAVAITSAAVANGEATPTSPWSGGTLRRTHDRDDCHPIFDSGSAAVGSGGGKQLSGPDAAAAVLAAIESLRVELVLEQRRAAEAAARHAATLSAIMARLGRMEASAASSSSSSSPPPPQEEQLEQKPQHLLFEAARSPVRLEPVSGRLSPLAAGGGAARPRSAQELSL